jgi:hypothetical protein
MDIVIYGVPAPLESLKVLVDGLCAAAQSDSINDKEFCERIEECDLEAEKGQVCLRCGAQRE